MGEEIDARTDVWAFGCVLYEMLTARPAFKGGSVSEVLAAVLRDEPGWEALPADASPSVVRLLRRCLRRDPHRRLQHIGDARLDLARNGGRAAPGSRGRRAPEMGASPRYLLIVAVALISSIGAWLLLRSSPDVPTPRTTRLSLELPARMALGNEFSAPFAIAPAGSPLVLEAIEGDTQRLYIRELGDPTCVRYPEPTAPGSQSSRPTGAWVAFFANRKLVESACRAAVQWCNWRISAAIRAVRHGRQTARSLSRQRRHPGSSAFRTVAESRLR